MIGTFIKLTDSCSAGCRHCPFASKLSLVRNINDIVSDVKSSNEPLIVLSGGEPFEHPQIDSILHTLSTQQDKIFRIATGGHVCISPYIRSLISMDNLTGLSLGTDILFANRNKNSLKNIFWENISLLNNNFINYSLTFTLGSDIDLDQIQSIISNKEISPKFYLLQYRDDQETDFEFVDEVSKLISNHSSEAFIHYANLN